MAVNQLFDRLQIDEYRNLAPSGQPMLPGFILDESFEEINKCYLKYRYDIPTNPALQSLPFGGGTATFVVQGRLILYVWEGKYAGKWDLSVDQINTSLYDAINFELVANFGPANTCTLLKRVNLKNRKCVEESSGTVLNDASVLLRYYCEVGLNFVYAIGDVRNVLNGNSNTDIYNLYGHTSGNIVVSASYLSAS